MANYKHKHSHFDRTFDIEGMLYDNAKWLAKQTGLTTVDFVEIAEQLSMTQKDWTTFWEMVRGLRKMASKNIEVYIPEKAINVNQSQLQKLREILGDPDEESNCCGADIYPHNSDDHTSRCMECKEGCGIVYAF